MTARHSACCIAVALMLSACGGGTGLTAEQEAWCTDNTLSVDQMATSLGVLDLVNVWYVTEGDGLAANGEPELTDRNIEVSEDLRARNDEDGDALFADLFANYLTHADGQQACSEAYENRQ